MYECSQGHSQTLTPFGLSSLLATVTSNSTYTEAARNSYNFIFDNFYSSSTAFLIDGLQTDSCQFTAFFAPQDSGIFIEGTYLYGSLVGDAAIGDQ